jgi:hypothetical protein
MAVQLGANGNVFGYNFSTEPYAGGEDWTPCDISLHGNQPVMNLFEGNIVQEVNISDYWGPVGPDNVFLRNEIQAENIEIMDHSDGQIIIGNRFSRGIVRLDMTVSQSSLTLWGNYFQGYVHWSSSVTNRIIPQSFYLKSKPSFYGAMEWPSTGVDKAIGTNPAEKRYHEH